MAKEPEPLSPTNAAAEPDPEIEVDVDVDEGEPEAPVAERIKLRGEDAEIAAHEVVHAFDPKRVVIGDGTRLVEQSPDGQWDLVPPKDTPPDALAPTLQPSLSEEQAAQLSSADRRRTLIKVLGDFGLLSKASSTQLVDTALLVPADAFLADVRNGMAFGIAPPAVVADEDAFADKLADWLGQQHNGARVSSNTWITHAECSGVASLLRQRAWRKPSSKVRPQ